VLDPAWPTPTHARKIPGYFWVGYPGTLAGSLGGEGGGKKKKRERDKNILEYSRKKAI
jgi:hypothetical protein